MKKILIADDEFLVRLGLKTTIDWQTHGFEIVGEAKNGKEALELFEQFNPDILLTDIRMPIMDGLELIQAIKQKKKTLKSIILTHYDDFNYAKEAIKLGASEYILKSDLNSDNLFNILNRLSNEIDSETAKSGEFPQIEKSNLTDNYELCQQLLIRLADEGFKSQNDFDEFIKNYFNVFELSGFVFLTGAIKIVGNSNINNNNDHFENTVNNVLKQSLESRSIILYSYIRKDLINVLINTSEENSNIYDAVHVFKQNMNKFLEADVSIGFSRYSNQPREIITLLKQSRIAMKYCFFELSGITVFDYSMIEKTDECPGVNLETLKSHIKLRETDKLKEYILSVFGALFNDKQIEYVKNVFYDFMSFAKIISTELKLEKGGA
jgi:two-component system response regulator YesN